MEEGYQLLKKHLNSDHEIFLVVDPDVDGYTSSSLAYNYLTEVLKENCPTINYHIPEGKEHGLQTIMDWFPEDGTNKLILLPDSSSNDYKCHAQLKDRGYDILVLDHHEAPRYSEAAIVINNQLSQKYPNKSLSGVGVVYKFLEYFEKREGVPSESQNYLDIVALGQVSDMMDMTTLENRWICDYGLSHINNDFFKALIEARAYSLGDGPLTQIGVAFYITPLINALIRVGNSVEKENLFKAFIEPNLVVKSTKRGETDKFETLATQLARICTNAKSRQDRQKEKAADFLNIQIFNNNLEDNKILILNADELDVANTLTGLCAMGVAAAHKKPVILGRTSPDGFLKGSARGRGESELKDFKNFLNESGLVSYAEGHANAFGVGVKLTDIDKLNAYANKKLANVNFNEGSYDVDFVVESNCSYLDDLIIDLDSNKKFWGQACPEPLIAVENLNIDKANIKTIGANQDTLRFEFNGITYIKFKAKDLIEKFDSIACPKVNLNIVGKANLNSWGGRTTPQIVIEELEIKETSIYDF